MKFVNNLFIYLLIIIFITFIFNTGNTYAEGSSLKKWALPLLGISAAAGYGAIHFRKKAKEKYDASEIIWKEYLAIPNGQPNTVFEKKYEQYEDKFSEAKSYRTYFLACLGGSALGLIGSVVLFFYKPSSSKYIDIGSNPDFTTGYNDVFIKVKF